MRMYVILALSAVLVIGLAFLAVCYARSRQRTRKVQRQQAVAERLNAVVAQAEREHRDRKAAATASAALTQVLPAIKQGDQVPRHVA